MQPRTKKIVIIASALLVIGGVVGYVLYKRKKDNELDGANKPADDKPVDDKTPLVVNKPVVDNKGTGVKPAPKTTTETPSPIVKPTIPVGQGKKVSAVDLLASNINGGNVKSLYAGGVGLAINNMNNEVSGKSVTGQRVGTIVSAKRFVSGSNKGYQIFFLGNGGIKYWVYAFDKYPKQWMIEV